MMSAVIDTQFLDRYLPDQARTYLEQKYYAPIGEEAQLPVIIHDPVFRSSPETHPALSSDHSIVHVRDVTQHLLQVLELTNGLLLPAREHDRLENFMKPYGVTVTYLHDIGLTDDSPIGQAMHPEFAAQVIFAEKNDELVETIWNANCGGLANYLSGLQQRGAITLDPKIVLREMLALTMSRSRRKVPVQVLNDPAALRNLMLASLKTELTIQFQHQQVEQLRTRMQQVTNGADHQATRDRLRQTLYAAEANLALAPASTDAGKQRASLQRLYQNFDAEAY